MRMTDPMEDIIRDALDCGGFTYTEDGKPGGEVNKAIDFMLTNYGIAIEVKQFHSDRIAGQMARHDNIIAVQGRKAVEFLASLLASYQEAPHHPRRGDGATNVDGQTTPPDLLTHADTPAPTLEKTHDQPKG